MVQGTIRINVPKLLETTGMFKAERPLGELQVNMSALQRATGLSYPTVYKLVKDDPEAPVTLDTAFAIARAFGKTVDEVIEPIDPKSG